MANTLTVVADENIPLLDELLGNVANIIRLPGRAMTAQQLANADILMVRSITTVNAGLLQGTPVRFVGTCTIGVDHIDQQYLAAQGIGFASAPGCNAAAVVDYVMAAMLAVEPDMAVWQQKTVGIIGYGEVGSRLYQRLRNNGIVAKCYDPFKAAATNTLDEVLSCDVVSLHVPLTKIGEHKTWHLLDKTRLHQLKPGALLINTSRGKVVDNNALLALLNTGGIQAVLDVYEDEPAPAVALLDALTLATAHIAGYSLHGKMRGTLQVAEKINSYFGLNNPLPDVLGQYTGTVTVNNGDSAAQVMAKAYDIRQDSADFIAAYRKAENTAEQSAVFDAYRKHYKNRYELAYLTAQSPDAAMQALLAGIGFVSKGQAFAG